MEKYGSTTEAFVIEEDHFIECSTHFRSYQEHIDRLISDALINGIRSWYVQSICGLIDENFTTAVATRRKSTHPKSLHNFHTLTLFDCLESLAKVFFFFIGVTKQQQQQPNNQQQQNVQSGILKKHFKVKVKKCLTSFSMSMAFVVEHSKSSITWHSQNGWAYSTIFYCSFMNVEKGISDDEQILSMANPIANDKLTSSTTPQHTIINNTSKNLLCITHTHTHTSMHTSMDMAIWINNMNIVHCSHRKCFSQI